MQMTGVVVIISSEQLHCMQLDSRVTGNAHFFKSSELNVGTYVTKTCPIFMSRRPTIKDRALIMVCKVHVACIWWKHAHNISGHQFFIQAKHNYEETILYLKK